MGIFIIISAVVFCIIYVILLAMFTFREIVCCAIRLLRYGVRYFLFLYM